MNLEIVDSYGDRVVIKRNDLKTLESKLDEAKGLYKHAIDSLNFIHQFTECDRARDCSKIELDRLMASEFYKLKEQEK